MGVAYLIGSRRLAARRRRGGATVQEEDSPSGAITRGGRPNVRGRQDGLFVVGYTALVVALISPLHSVGEQFFSVHMVQHLLLSLVAPPLLLLSGSMPVLLWAFSARDRVTLGRLVGQPGPLRSALEFVTRPLVALGLFVITQWVWHQPGAYDWALENRWAHYFEHVSFFLTAIIFWWPVIGAPPLRSPLKYPARLGYTFVGWLPNSILGAGIALARAPLYPYYVGAAQQTGTDPLFDQQLAGLIMWVPGDVVFAAILLIIFAAYLRDEERKAEWIDRELDAREAQLRT